MNFLITAIGSMSAEAVIREISRQSSMTIIGCNMYPKEWSAASRLVEKFYQVPSSKEEDAYIARVLKICEKECISHIIPLTDPEVDVLSENRHRFNDKDVTLCISSTAAIRLARDKLAIHEYFSKHPRIHPIPTVDLQDDSCLAFHYPMLAKPRRGRSSEGQVYIPDATALQFWRERLSGSSYVVQPHHVGDIFVVDLVRQSDGIKSVAVTRQELLRTSNGAGMSVRLHSNHECNTLAIETADEIGLHGCINIEFLIVNNSPLLMDVNPRFSAGVAFSIMSGYNMVTNHLNCFSNKQIDASHSPIDKVYTRGFIEYS